MGVLIGNVKTIMILVCGYQKHCFLNSGFLTRSLILSLKNVFPEKEVTTSEDVVERLAPTLQTRNFAMTFGPRA